MKFQSNGIGDNCRFVKTLLAICIAFVAVAASVTAQKRQAETSSKAPAAFAPAWLQWGGPNRDFKVATQGVKENWPAGAPKQLWGRPLGEGHSSILVEQGKLYTMYSSGNLPDRAACRFMPKLR